MSLVQDSFDFGDLHTPVRVGPAEFALVRKQFFGLQGESHVLGRTYGRDLTCELTLTDYGSDADLQFDIDTIQNQAGTLTGALICTINAVVTTYANATFLGCKVVREKMLDGLGLPVYGGHGWFAVVELEWRQIAAP